MTSLDHNNNLCLVPLHFPSSTSCHCPDHVPLRELGKKFDEIQNLKITSNNNPTNILNNLCTGLETFLGFNPESKGYDGSGIVYSDLDRLCDGVMGFLSGVLGAVKNTQTYNVGRKTLQNLVSNEINKHLCSGHEGFKTLFDELPQRTAAYNSEVDQGNERVKRPIKKLINHVNDDTKWKKSLKQILEDEKVNDPDTIERLYREVNDRLAECKTFANTYNVAFNLEVDRQMRDAVNDLNDKLRNDVKNASKAVKHETKRLEQLAQKEWEDYKYMKKSVRVTMDTLKLKVNGEIKYQVDELVKRLKLKVQQIKTKLETIKTSLEEYILNLTKWKEAGAEAVKLAKKQCGVIVEKLNGGDTEKDAGTKGGVKYAAEQLREKAEELRGKAYAAKTQVEGLVLAAIGAVKDMDRTLKDELAAVKSQIKIKLDQYIKNKFIDQIRDALEGMTDKIARRNGQNAKPEGHLERIVTGVSEYARLFEQKFKAAIVELIGRLVESEGIRTYIYWYVSDVANKSTLRGTDENEKLDAVKRTIQEYMKHNIQYYVDTAAQSAGLRDAIEDLSQLVGSFRIFSRDIEKEIRVQLNANTVTSTLAGMVTTNDLPTTSNGFLNSAIEMIVSTVSTFSKHMCQEVKLLIETANIADLQRAMDKVKGLGQSLKGELKTIGSTNLSTQYDTKLIEILNGQLPEKSGTVDVVSSASLVAYRSHVNTAFGEPTGKLPSAINNIQKQGLASLAELVNEPGNDDTIGTQTFNKLRATVDSNLEKFTTGVKDLVKKENTGTDKDSVHAYLEDLGKMLEREDIVQLSADGLAREHTVKGIEKIIENFTTLKSNLETGPIAWANNFIVFYADVERQETIRLLAQYVDTEAQKTQTTLTTLARKQYVTSVKALLTAFAEKVSEELAPLPAEIDEDLTIGFKGLMRVMGGVSSDTGKPKSGAESLLEKIKKVAERFSVGSRGAITTKENFEELSKAFQAYFAPVYQYINDQISAQLRSNPQALPPPPATDDNLTHLTDVNSKFNELLNHLKTEVSSPRTYIFDNTFTKKHDLLSTSLHHLTPSAFANPRHPELLDAVRQGLEGFVEQMERVYVNGYEGDPSIHFAWDGTFTSKLSDHGKNCCKVFLTVLEILSHDLEELMTKSSKQWMRKQINTYQDDTFGRWFERQGYKVNTVKGKQHGELQDKETMMGSKICDEILSQRIKNFTKDSLQTPWIKELLDLKKATKGNTHPPTVLDILQYLSYHLHHYYEVCHLGTSGSKKQPSSIYEMLIWFAGLPNNSVHRELTFNYFSTLFDEADEQASDENKKAVIAVVNGDAEAGVQTEPSISVVSDVSLPAYPHNITPGSLTAALTDVCAQSHSVLTAIQGHGHAGGVYAVDFNTNEFKFSYPSDPAKCFDVLVDMLHRLYDQLYFLFIQCSRTYKTNSWRECWYGRYVGGSDWRCNDKQCPNQMNGQTCNQIANQKADQTCDQHPKCGLKSPLQSFLEDGLPGFLPHQFGKPGCKLECTVAKHRGIPCMTPMGFSDISNVASHTKQGEHIKEVLDELCGNSEAPLTRICSQLLCLLQRPPQTLGDMFAFYYNFFVDWNRNIKGRVDVKTHKKSAFIDAVTGANFGVPYPQLDMPTVFFTRTQNDLHTKGDMLCLFSCDSTSSSTATCGRYLKPFRLNTWTVFSQEHADKYLSWILYITETLYQLLEQLYKECCSNCDKPGTRCSGKVCSKTCKVKYTDEGKSRKSDKPCHTVHCKPISHCPFTRPTLCKYGFVFKSLSNMSGESGEETIRTCKDLCNALQKVLSDKIDDEAPLAKLVHDVIPKFIWNIRSKFFWLNVALWLLSLLYLLHIMVIRLDLLHIKSHLHSPSSHRIAAQSLLAAARVGSLGKISYLQP
ncbi:hypothetical protein, conserved [Babesia bigemina]|uniref:C3H1-type domain-containing protein n=1 Tax=Babesia bigemina TaxID=5866 RepID=A0A061BJZ8_BABBI|nr:hypothetical protein, conserved [Babesia bigemina]CDR71782.1 hypothetical protein, conserved [Babesia bigemina]|eukprot:XP_012770726.1 hypothetical protein, conserved [Babesia bigemina]